MKVEIINAWESRYQNQSRTRLIPPLTTAHLAALCPSHVRVSVRHEQVRPVDFEVDADLVAITFMTGYAQRAYWMADRFRQRGTCVVLGGPHASLLPEEAMRHADTIAVGEAEYTWPRILQDFKRKQLQPLYRSEKMHDLRGLPIPRYDLMEDEFVLNHFVQATRGCPFVCSFCCLKALDNDFRVRPIDEVVRDVTHYEGRNWLQNKFVWFWDDNIIGNKAYAKELFRRLRPLKKWWFSQASVDMASDKELVHLAAESGCAGIFLGVESFSDKNLRNIKKYQNQKTNSPKATKTLHDYGIGVMAGLIAGFDEDTPETLRRIPEIVEELGIDVPFLNIMTPFWGTGVHSEYERAGRILTRDWSLYNGMSVVYRPAKLTSQELGDAYLAVWQELFSVRKILARMAKDLRNLSFRRLIASACINGYYGMENNLGHIPIVKHAPEADIASYPSLLTQSQTLRDSSLLHASTR